MLAEMAVSGIYSDQASSASFSSSACIFPKYRQSLSLTHMNEAGEEFQALAKRLKGTESESLWCELPSFWRYPLLMELGNTWGAKIQNQRVFARNSDLFHGKTIFFFRTTQNRCTEGNVELLLDEDHDRVQDGNISGALLGSAVTAASLVSIVS